MTSNFPLYRDENKVISFDRKSRPPRRLRGRRRLEIDVRSWSSVR
jgi:hypothetical protein